MVDRKVIGLSFEKRGKEQDILKKKKFLLTLSINLVKLTKKNLLSSSTHSNMHVNGLDHQLLFTPFTRFSLATEMMQT
jgi:hypothetical protein